MTGDLGRQINDLSVRAIFVSAFSLFLLVAVASLAKGRFPSLKPPIFILIAFTVLISTSTLLGSAIYLNSSAESKGPVHWRAGIEYWACGVQLEIRNPNGILTNKIGTPTVYEHDDQQIHVEGMIINKQIDATLGKFMRVIGGDISSSKLILPVADNIIENTTDGDLTDPLGASRLDGYTFDGRDGKEVVLRNNDQCDGKLAEVQTYVYSFNKTNRTYTQKKISNPESYVIRDEETVPAGDCIIVEFGLRKDRTDRLCEPYGKRDDKRCTYFGIKQYSEKQCDIREVLPTKGKTP